MTGVVEQGDGAPDVPEAEDTLWETQRVRIIIAVALLLILIALVVFVNVPALRANAGISMTKTDWQLESYQDGTGIMIPALPGTVVTAQFKKDGTVSGSAGCNLYSASFITSDYSIAISGPTQTLRACTDQAAMAQEELYLTRLESSKEFRLTGTNLKMYGADGKTLLVFIPIK